MSISGVPGNPSKLLFLPAKRSCLLQQQVSGVHYNRSLKAKMRFDFCLNRYYWSRTTCGNLFRKTHKIQNAMDASFGDISDDSNGTAVFPRINVRDPYKRLGISREASEEEIQAARKFLINKYAGHKPSVDAIESAHDKIIMQSFYEKKNPKINIKKKIQDVSQSRIVTALTSRFEAPSTKFIIKTSIAFVVLGALSVLFPTDEGPTLQVAISLIASIYFIYDRLKSRIRAFLYGTNKFLLYSMTP
ncbi:protein CHAPERONE-LIKE PROTEIN OF POR1, chloroplastic-like isoform X2 [Aristolochia californica]|uniref:protein CHAPERONE-LIKE PROTEIN OF POR1, chloroplastic-like isoform X2 n=1 Tax=Aristolochia californica TaxID=171875 RepID=UPI0035E39FF3